MTSPLAIRGAQEADLDSIMQLEAHGFMPAIRENIDVMQTRLRHFPAGFLVLENTDKQAIGYLCSELWDATTASAPAAFTLGHDIRQTHHHAGRCLYISSMTIHPSLRGSGIGNAFFSQCLARLRQELPHIDRSMLLLSAEWSGAHRIYRACGYQESARLPGFFSMVATHDADAIVMQYSFES